MGKQYEVVKAFELGQPGDIEQFAAGDIWELPRGWVELDKSQHATLSHQPFPVFQSEEKKPVKDENGKTTMRVTVREVVLPVKPVD